jgi:hypothetical protein
MDYTAPASPSPTVPPPDTGRELRELRLAMGVTLVSLVILAGSLGVYLFRQVSMLRRQNDTATRAANQAFQHYKQNIESQAVRFEQALVEFSKTHTDLQPRIAKYFQAAGAPTAGTTNNASPQ